MTDKQKLMELLNKVAKGKPWFIIEDFDDEIDVDNIVFTFDKDGNIKDMSTSV